MEINALEQSIARPVISRPRVALVGLGRLNLGFMAPLFRNAGFELFGVNLARPKDTPEARVRSSRKVKILEADGYYLLNQVGDPAPRQIEMQGASLFDEQQPDAEDSRRAVMEAAQSSVLVSAIGTSRSAQERWVNFVLRILKERMAQKSTSKLDICAADNPIMRTFATTLFQKRLLDVIACDVEHHALRDHLHHHVHFPLLIADRICSRLEIRDHLSVLTEKYGMLRCSEGAYFLKDVEDANPAMVSINTATLEMYRLLKISMFSCAHAIAAYLGALNPKCVTVDEALESNENWDIVSGALEDITKVHQRREGLPEQEIFMYKQKIMKRISEPQLRDSIHRVGRGPIRKLHRDGRIGGAALLTLYNNQRVSKRLAAGLAAGLAYAYNYDSNDGEKPDEQAMELREELKRGGNDMRKVLRVKCRIGNGGEFGSEGKIEQRLLDTVDHYYSQYLCRQLAKPFHTHGRKRTEIGSPRRKQASARHV